MKPRIVKPESGNKYYIHTSDGGYNGARGNPLRLNSKLTSLPNCCSIYGWFNEIGGQGMKYLKAPWYPYTVIEAAKREGLEVTTEPTLGGIMVWTGGKTGEGHVAGVGEIVSDTKVLTVESEYYGRDWTTFFRARGDGSWRDGCYWMGASYKYQGCIKNPFVEEDMTYEETKKLIEEMVPKIIDKRDAERANASADAWAEPYIEWAVKHGYMVGDAEGNFHPKKYVERQELAVVAKAIKEG